MKPDSRRSFLSRLTGIVVGLGAVLAGWPLFRSLVPNVLYEPPKRFRVGAPQDFQQGVIDTSDVIFYLSFIFFSLFLTTRVLESRRWRR